VAWVLLSSGNIFFMQAGFMFLEWGGMRRKNIRHSMLKAYLGICMSSIMFYLIGYAIGFGDNNETFAGFTMFAGYQINANRMWCF
jgi:Amt family ammonium transporter